MPGDCRNAASWGRTAAHSVLWRRHTVAHIAAPGPLRLRICTSQPVLLGTLLSACHGSKVLDKPRLGPIPASALSASQTARRRATTRQYLLVPVCSICEEAPATAHKLAHYTRQQSHIWQTLQLAGILDALAARFGIAAGAEVSMEADPGTFNVCRLREYMALGVNRFSVGVQAFQQVHARRRPELQQPQT